MDGEASELEDLEHIMSDASADPIKLSYGLLRSITDNFSKEIGRGGFGAVYQGVLQNGDVAVKKLLNLHALPEKQFLDEITCLKKAKHKNIVKFLGYCSETRRELLKFNGTNVMGEAPQKLLCFEYVPNGNIKHYLQQEKLNGDDWPLRYQMIRGICQGLHYLHGEHINHLDLKPENVMLDAHMEPKITDFGLSRFLDQGQSKIITENVVGTLRYIAPETIRSREISLKSDIYALGIIIIELLTGIDKVDLDTWDKLSDDMDCPRAKKCAEIARNCTDHDKRNRPTIDEIIGDLDELENSLKLTNGTGSSINQVTSTAVPGTELIDVYPLELSFPFVPNREMHCHLSVTNKTDCVVYGAVRPGVPGRYRGEFKFVLPPRFTGAIPLHRKAEEELPLDTDQLEIWMLISDSDEDVYQQQITMLCLDEEASCFEDKFQEVHELLGFELHRVMLTSVVVVSTLDDGRASVEDSASQEEETTYIDSMDVHPTEPWVLIVDEDIAYIWNWQTKERTGKYESCAAAEEDECSEDILAKFIARKQWVIIGTSSGSILVRTSPTMDPVNEFKAHHDGVTSLAVHPSRPFVLTCSSSSLRIWDWNHSWSCTGVFCTTPGTVRKSMFHPRYTDTFATLHQGVVQTWRIGHSDPIATTEKFGHYCAFTYCGDRHQIAASLFLNTCILDMQQGKRVHRLYILDTADENMTSSICAIVCHPTRRVLVTASCDGTIHIWDSTTYRLKKTYDNLPKYPIHIGFAGSRRLVIGYKEEIRILNIDLE